MIHPDPRHDEREGMVRELARWPRRFHVAAYLADCLPADDLERAFETEQVGVLFNLQDPSYIGSNLSNPEVLYNSGVRIIQLT